MASSFRTVVLVVITILSLYAPYARSNRDPEQVPVLTEFIESLENAIEFAKDVTSEVSNVGYVSSLGLGDVLFGKAIKSCIDLLDLSVYKLNLSLSVLKNPKDDESFGSGNLVSDLKRWFSDVLINQATCLDVLEDANGSAKVQVERKFNQMSALLGKLLGFVRTLRHYSSSGVSIRSLTNRRVLKPSERRVVRPHVVVAKDGTGDFTSIIDAVNSAPDHSKERYIIHIRRGIYNEYVHINAEKTNLVIIGDGTHATIITGNRSAGDGWHPYESATFVVEAAKFTALDLTFENTAGAAKNQALAVRSHSDLAVFYRVAFKGYQDTLYLHTGRQFFKNCKISGSMDFIFGYAIAVFQDSKIIVRKGTPTQGFYTIAAHGGKNSTLPNATHGGFSFQFCRIIPGKDFLASNNTYLGRPWKLHSRTVFLQSYLSEIINPKGWIGMSGNENSPTVYFAEFHNYGPGANVRDRVKWPGYHANIPDSEALQFTVSSFIDGDDWLPATGIPYLRHGFFGKP